MSERPCRVCGVAFVPTMRQINSRDYICAPCYRAHEYARRAKRKAEGRPVPSGRPPYPIGNPVAMQKIAARSRAKWAITSGKILKRPCEVCGSPNTEAHHDDYSKPLEVRFLCRLHHVAHHRETARGTQQ